jgi:thiosulfate/3-mercaptopyruvate sulfurtransferase
MTPAWLAGFMSGAPVVAQPSGAWLLFEVGYGTAASFSEEHIPGARYLDTQQFERGPLWNKVPDREMLGVLLDNGIRHDTTVLLYGRNTLGAARVAHLMLYAGVRDVRLLDGGFAAWKGAAYAVASGASHAVSPASDFGAPFPAHPEYVTDIDQAREILLREDGVLVSIRTWDEFIGKTSGYSYIPVSGDIPGARWGRAGDNGDVNSMSDFHRPDGTMKSAGEIQAFWGEAGIRGSQRTAFYCGTGWRASLAFFYAWLMGWPQISVYDGGWCEWSRHPQSEGVLR